MNNREEIPLDCTTNIIRFDIRKKRSKRPNGYINFDAAYRDEVNYIPPVEETTAHNSVPSKEK